MRYEPNLAIPDIQWLGLRCSDRIKFGVPEQGLLCLTRYDRKRGLAMLKEGCLDDYPEWRYRPHCFDKSTKAFKHAYIVLFSDI
jgi:hypothetical protein